MVKATMFFEDNKGILLETALLDMPTIPIEGGKFVWVREEFGSSTEQIYNIKEV